VAETRIIEPCSEFDLASVIAGRNADPSRLSAALGAALPSGPRSLVYGQDRMIGVAPDRWLVLRKNGAVDLAGELEEKLAGLALVVDQSSAYSLWRLRGEKARELLQRGISIDLHPASFSVGSAAVTQLAHIGVMLCQTGDQPSYLVACYRSFAGSFAHWMEEQLAAL